MEYINISHKKNYTCKIHAVSSEKHESLSASNLLQKTGYWCSRENYENISEYIILDYHNEVIIDCIELTASPNGPSAFPREFRLEGSLDNNYWQIIHTEKNLELEGDAYLLNIPIARVRFLKLVILAGGNSEGKYYSEIGEFRSGIAGIKSISAISSRPDNIPENLLLEDFESCWESDPASSPMKEVLSIDLGKIFHINRIILGSSMYGFPENFCIQASPDNDIWTTLLEEKNFMFQENKKYFWNTDITPAQFIRIEISDAVSPDASRGVRLAMIEVSAAPFDPFHTHNTGNLTPYASIFQAGIARLARNGEDAPGTVIQADDRRLRDAGTIFKGIVQFAQDGESREGMAVQASDTRLNAATELKPGIVRLAHDRETKAGSVVQGNDSRLHEAGVNSFGIIKLCPDGMYKQDAAVTGNDSRLHKATEQSHGISRLAPDGDTMQGLAVQAHDKRLRSATTNFKGIVELAEDGEDSPGVTVQGNDKRLKIATTKSKGIVELAEDGEDYPGVAVQGNDRRLKDATAKSKGIVELAEDGEDLPGVAVQGNDRRLKDATTKSKGILTLAEDGGDSAGAAVQGNDLRLKDATTKAKGIVELAEDGEDSAGVAVQGDDRRLKDATTKAKGIVELAEDGEDSAGVAVQGDDKRLKKATTKSNGIVGLAESGQDRPGVAVQGNDRRLKDATTKSKGIVELAENGEDRPGVAVQGNDRRLKNATTKAKGIVEMAEDGEDSPGKAVQGNDKRLKAATTLSKGLVELAEDGEDSPGVAVQGSDRRLKYASEKSHGIVMIAKNGESAPGSAVQANDERLADARTPLPHNHEYAKIDHDYNSHSGTISIRSARHEALKGITPPSEDSSVMYAKNESADSVSIGVSGIAGISAKKNIRAYGVLGHGGHIGVRGQSSGYSDGNARGCGVLGASRFGAGGAFASEQDYSLYVDGYGRLERYDDSLDLSGNGDALFVSGKSDFHGTIHISNSMTGETGGVPANIVELFEVDDAEYISPGDLLVVSPAGKSVLSRSRTEYNRAAAGVVSGNPTVIINNSGKEKKVYPVALVGTVLCKIDARSGPVKPGDLIVTSGTPGCGMAGRIDSFEKIGTVVGKALDSLDDGIGIIPIFIAHR